MLCLYSGKLDHFVGLSLLLAMAKIDAPSHQSFTLKVGIPHSDSDYIGSTLDIPAISFATKHPKQIEHFHTTFSTSSVYPHY